MNEQPVSVDDADRLESRLDWLRRVESVDEATARRHLRARLRSDAAVARSELRSLTPWPGMTATVTEMLERDAEVVRLHRVVTKTPIGARILDVGCGPGVVAGHLALHDRPGAYLGIDFSEPKIESARAMAIANGVSDRLQFEVGDATALPDGRIDELQPDTVLILEVLEHLQDPASVLTSIADAVAPDATIIFSVPLLGRIEACWGHRTLYGADAIVGLATQCGLGIVDVEEVHNTWALATVSRRSTVPALETSVRPVTIAHRTAQQLVVTGADHDQLTGPSRLRVDVEAGQTVRIDARSPGADWLRLDLELTGGPAQEMGVFLLDVNETVMGRWHEEFTDLQEGPRTTVVLRPSEQSRPADQSGGSVATTRLQLTAGSAPVVLTVWRLGFAAGYRHLVGTPSVPLGGTSPGVPAMSPPDRLEPVRRLARRWPQLGRVLRGARRRVGR